MSSPGLDVDRPTATRGRSGGQLLTARSRQLVTRSNRQDVQRLAVTMFGEATRTPHALGTPDPVKGAGKPGRVWLVDRQWRGGS